MSEARKPERRRERQAEPENQDSEEATERREPVGRRDAFSFHHSDHFYVCHCYGFSQEQYELYSDSGYSEDQLLPLQRFDFSTAQWSGVSPVCVDRDRKGKRKRTRFPDCGQVCCAVVGDCAYIFGGRWKHGYAVHELNLETFVWQKIEPQNREDGPMRKESAGMVACGGEALCVFGGYGPVPGRQQPGATYHDDQSSTLSTCFTNELHLFHLRTATWSSPETTGSRPPPCANFSFTKVDLSRAVLFGGEQRHERVNELHILDIENWHWSGAILPTSSADRWPKKRSLHSACVLFDPIPHSPSSDMSAVQRKPQLFVLWGEGNDNAGSLRAPWILNVNSLTWKRVKLPVAAGATRERLSLGCYNRSPTEAELVVFGGKNPELPSMVIISDDTTLLFLGMKTLYHSCLDYVAERYELYQSLLQQLLPPHIRTDVCRERDKRANEAHYRVVQL